MAAFLSTLIENVLPRGVGAVALLLTANIAPVIAADVRVFGGAAPQHVLRELAIEFKRAAGCITGIEAMFEIEEALINRAEKAVLVRVS